MFPWLLHTPPIPTYGTLLLTGFLAAWLWARRRARTASLDPSRLDLLMPLLLAAGLLGAWLFGKLTSALTDDATDTSVLIGSLLLSTTAGIAYALLSRIPLGILGNIAPLALGIAIGRIGCFCAGCCFGKLSQGTTFLTAIHFPKNSIPFLFQLHNNSLPADNPSSLAVYPVQLYESALCFFLALLLAAPLSLPKKPLPGERFLALGIGYALIRFNLEFLRADNPPINGLTFSQWNSLLIAALAFVTFTIRRVFAQRLHLTADAANSFRAVSL